MAHDDVATRLEPNTRAFLEGLIAQGIPPLENQSVEEARLGAAALQAVPIATLPAAIEDRTLPGGPGGEVSVRIVRPHGQRGLLPVVVYLHGGGWVLNDKDAYDRLIREIANGAEAAVVFVNFTRSPEVRYPIAIEEAYAATQWVATHGSQLHLDGSRLAIVGDSAGGNLAAAVTLLAKERGGPNITYQVLLYPVTDANFDTPSYREFADGPFLTREAMKWFWNHYAPEFATRTEPTASPLRASPIQLRDLPPALMITAELDVLRDEGEAYARRLSEAGVPVTAVRYLGTIHGFASLNAITDTPAPRAAIAQVNAMLRSVFSG